MSSRGQLLEDSPWPWGKLSHAARKVVAGRKNKNQFDPEERVEHDTLHILWTNDNPVTAELMVFMYATNALKNGWWKHVHVIVWGATAKLLAEDDTVRGLVRTFSEAGGDVSACKRCAEKLGVLEKLEEIPELDILYIGKSFTDILKSGDKLIAV